MNQTKPPDPPPGPPWDLSVDEAPLAFVDLEMSGLDVRKHRVIEICIERTVAGTVVDRIETLVCPFEPGAALPDLVGNQHIHGITRDDLARAPTFHAIAGDVERLLGGAILVAHAAMWDVSFLEMELARAGRPLEIEHFLDTLVLARRAFALGSHSLDALCSHFQIQRGNAHRAGSDVAAMREVFAKAIAELRPVSARDLWEVRIAERRARASIVDACVAAVEKGAPVQLTYRPSRRKPEPMIMVLTEVRADLDPPRVIGYQLPGRGRRDLRSDRILRIDPAEQES